MVLATIYFESSIWWSGEKLSVDTLTHFLLNGMHASKHITGHWSTNDSPLRLMPSKTGIPYLPTGLWTVCMSWSLPPKSLLVPKLPSPVWKCFGWPARLSSGPSVFAFLPSGTISPGQPSRSTDWGVSRAPVAMETELRTCGHHSRALENVMFCDARVMVREAGSGDLAVTGRICKGQWNGQVSELAAWLSCIAFNLQVKDKRLCVRLWCTYINHVATLLHGLPRESIITYLMLIFDVIWRMKHGWLTGNIFYQKKFTDMLITFRCRDPLSRKLHS